MNNGKIAAVIGVRKGSERIVNKNIKPFNDTSLLENKIKTLKKVKKNNDMPIQIRLFVYHFNVKIRLMNSIGCDKITLFRFNLINKFNKLISKLEMLHE